MFLHGQATERNDTGAKASGFVKMLSKFGTYFMFKLLTLVFSWLETVSAALQKAASTRKNGDDYQGEPE